MTRKPCKVVVTVEVEVTATKALLAEGRQVAKGPSPANRKDALMDIFYARLAGAPGFQIAGMKVASVEWFEFDPILDPRHPEYRAPRGAAGRAG